MAATAPDYPAQFLKDTDKDRYLATLLVPADARVAVTALYAFGADCAAISGRVREPAPGEIRLQWWADALTGEGHGDVSQNPLAAALLDTLARYRLPAGPLLRLVNARRFDLYHDPMPDMDSFEGYAGETVSALYQLAAMVLNKGEPVEPGDAAGHLGVAHALIGHLRAFGFHASQGRVMLPLSVFTAHGVSESAITTGTDSPQLQAALAQLADMAKTHLDQAQAAAVALPRAVRPVFAPIGLLRLDWKRVQRQVQQPFAVPQATPDWRKIAAMAGWGWRFS